MGLALHAGQRIGELKFVFQVQKRPHRKAAHHRRGVAPNQGLNLGRAGCLHQKILLLNVLHLRGLARLPGRVVAFAQAFELVLGAHHHLGELAQHLGVLVPFHGVGSGQALGVAIELHASFVIEQQQHLVGFVHLQLENARRHGRAL